MKKNILSLLLIISLVVNAFLFFQCKSLSEEVNNLFQQRHEATLNLNETSKELSELREKYSNLLNSNAEKNVVHDENGIELSLSNDLPYTVSLIGYQEIMASCIIENITYKTEKIYNGTYDVTFYFKGKKTYDEDGDKSLTPCHFRAVLYDSNGNVYDTETVAGSSVIVGTEFDDVYCTFDDLPSGTSWVLKIKDED